ncbi:LOW QUALITY PROTEIN: uncharacterized protein LOC134837406 [Culicoides brevitarsis]|uniref:LOW QUALITY PROTEIN: uncharacterized protein LOC134837406 n=1 Tax=Culicoides brevitarsis TaxID=469753 RepID=UPI00307C0623
MLSIILFSILTGLVSYIFYLAVKRQNYWKDRNIPHIKAPIWGHVLKPTLLQENIADTLNNLYHHKDAQGQKFVGINIFHKPSILIRDPELIKRVLVKDFNYFANRHVGADTETDPLSANNLFQVNNPMWKIIRTKLSPIFTSGKMKQMFYMVDKVGNDMNEVITSRVAAGNAEFSVRNLFAMFTVDAITLVAFATEANCLKNPEESEVLKNAKIAFSVTTLEKISTNCLFFLQDFLKLFRLKTFNPKFANFMSNLFHEVTKERIKSGGVRNDLIDFLIHIKSADQEGIMTDDVLLAQAMVFFFAGFETSSSTMEFAFYFLAKYPEVQAKVRDEIERGFEKHGKLTYEFISNDMPYTSKVIKETLRLFPTLPFLDRECDPPTGMDPGYSLEPFSDFRIPKGMPIYIPAHAIQHDPQYFSDPERFDPDRFDGSKSYNEYTYMPFGLGPRNCIGERFAHMQMKIGIVHVLRSFTVEPSAGTPDNFKLDRTNTLMHPEREIVLKFIQNPIKMLPFISYSHTIKMIFENILAFLIILVSFLLYWGYRRQTFWARHNVPHVKSPLFLGNFYKTMFLKEHLSVTFDFLYNHAVARNEPFIGVNLFHKPIVLLRDPALIKRILIKDFNCFYERHTSGNPKNDPVGANNMFQVRNPKWRILRHKISPVFTASKMKKMFYMIEKVGSDLNERVKYLVTEKGNHELEVKELSGYFTTDVISIVAFGTHANSIKTPETSEFLKAAKESFMHSTWSKLAFNCVFFLPEVMSALRLKTFDPSFEAFLRRVLKDVMNERNKSGGVRNDLVDVLLEIQKAEEGNRDTIFTEDVILAQAAVFVAAGFETSSSTIAFALYEISKNQSIHDRVREEIASVLKTHNGFPYEAITNELPYLHAVISETLRMYPILGVLDRECVIPDGYSLEPFSDFKIPCGMAVYVPVAPIHYNPEHFPEPHIFDPTRFLDKDAHADTFLGFGLGPRNCIGERFAWIQVKMAIVSLLKSFKIELGSTSVPLPLDETCILSVPKEGIKIKFTVDELQ